MAQEEEEGWEGGKRPLKLSLEENCGLGALAGCCSLASLVSLLSLALSTRRCTATSSSSPPNKVSRALSAGTTFSNRCALERSRCAWCSVEGGGVKCRNEEG